VKKLWWGGGSDVLVRFSGLACGVAGNVRLLSPSLSVHVRLLSVLSSAFSAASSPPEALVSAELDCQSQCLVVPCSAF
jgi:hypothetical protein